MTSPISLKGEFLLCVQRKDFLFPGVDGPGNVLFHLCFAAIVWPFKGGDLKKGPTLSLA